MKYVVIKLGTKQFTVKEGDIFELEAQKPPYTPEVLMLTEGEKSLIGEPTLEDVHVKLSLVETKKSPKIRVFRFKSKSRYRKNNGHSQAMSVLKVDEIITGKSSKTEDKPAEEKAKTEKVEKAKTSAKVTKSKSLKATPAKAKKVAKPKEK